MLTLVRILKRSRLAAAFSLAKRLFAGYYSYIAIFFALGIVGGFFEALGVNALIPLFSIFVGDGNIGTDPISQAIASSFEFIGIPFTMPSMLIFITSLFILKALVLVIFHYVEIKLTTKYREDTMNRLFQGTLKAKWSYLLGQRSGDLDTLIKIDVVNTSILLETFVRGIVIISSLAIYLLIALNISETVTLLMLISGGVVFFIFKPIYMKAREVAHQLAMLNKNIAHHVNEQIMGMKVVKAMGVEERITEISSDFFAKLRALQIRTTMFGEILTASIQPITVIFIASVVAFAFYQTSYNIGALAAIIYLIQRIFSYVRDAQSTVYKMNDSIPYAQSVLKYTESMEAAREVEAISEKNGNAFEFNNSLVLNDVDFGYETGNTVLKGVNISIEQGRMVGLIGPSGAGKTTIFDLILRLLEPTKGSLELDGVPFDKVSIKALRKAIAYVPQDTFLINDTVKNNIRFFDDTVSDEDIIDAAKRAHIYDTVMELPDGLDTHVGERGTLFSTGQRQRIAIARALARKPQLLLLDEVTSALDAESEQRIQQAIQELKGKVTVCVIAHRLSTVRAADMLYVLEHGKIIESGTPRELLSRKETYFSRVYGILK